MALELRPSLKLSTGLVMTQQMQQALKLLQMGRFELVEEITKEMMENPLLELSQSDTEEEVNKKDRNLDEKSEAKEKDEFAEAAGKEESEINEEFDWENYLGEYSSTPAGPAMYEAPEDTPTFESFTSKATTLIEHLSWQWRLTKYPKTDILIGQSIIGNIGDDGYLAATLEDVASQMETSVEKVCEVLYLVQQLEPAGVGARDLRECLLLQLKVLEKEDSLAYAICFHHLDLIEKRNYSALAKILEVKVDKIYEAVQLMQTLDPRPGRMYSTDPPQYITPDVKIIKVGNEYVININDDGLPRLRLSQAYRKLIKITKDDEEARSYLMERLRGATSFIRYVNQRQRTIYRVTESIFKFQLDFLDKGVEYLKPLILREVADDVELHESTISRVTTNKYVHTPRGIYELKYFFDSPVNRFQGEAISSESVKMRIRQIIEAEDIQKPLSDQRIADILRGGNVDIARRTVAKYRESMGVGSSSERRSPF